MDELKEYVDITGQSGALSADLDLLLLRLRRQVLWLRHRWRDAPGERYQALAVSDREADLLAAEGHRWDERAAFFRENTDAAFLTGLLRDATARDERRSPFAAIQFLFGLTAFERDVLLMAAAVEVAPGLDRLYAYVQDDAGLVLPTPSMSMSLFFDTWGEAVGMRGAFHPSAPLFAHDLIEWASEGRGGSLTRPFRITERTLGYLMGSREPDHRIAGMIFTDVLTWPSRLPAARIWPDECALLCGRIGESLAPGSGHRLLINLVGHEEGMLADLASAACAGAEMPLLKASFHGRDGSDMASAKAARLLFRESKLRSAAICLKAGTEAMDMAVGRSIIAAAWEYAPLTFVISSEPWPAHGLGHEFPCLVRMEMRLPPLDHARRVMLWEEGLRVVSAEGEPVDTASAQDLANRFQFGADVISSVIEKAAETAGPDNRSPLSRLMDACRDVAAPGMAGPGMEVLAVKSSSSWAWEDIVLPSDVTGQLREIASQFRMRHKVFGEWGFGRKLERGRGICVLFSGPSGTGKTMAAEILANDLGLSLYRIDLSGVVNKYIGETEKNLRRVFDEGERCQALLFFDEADALFGKRSEVRDSHDRYANIEVNYLLQRMEAYTGASILATNMRTAIDGAFMRRLRYIVEFPMPDAALRETIWRKSFPPEAAMDGIDFRFLAKQFGISGGNIKNAALNAAFLAAADDSSIGMKHVVRAVKREYAKLGRLCVEAEFGKYL